VAKPPVEEGGPSPRERMEEARDGAARAHKGLGSGVEQARLTFRRLVGLDRSGPPPAQTLAGQPWHVWTIPNAIGFVRLGLIPVFLVLAFSSDAGTDALPAVVYAVIAWSDYADGIAARLTGQYSRFGALLDPVVDRLLVIAGVVVCWHFTLLPRWALAVLVARELFMLAVSRPLLRRGVELKINWWGRWAVWPVMTAIFAGLVSLETLGAVMLYLGLALTIVATVQYGRSARAQLRARQRPPSSST
jgi:CDP-diacylglycerol---glycerol-3-phosphate 3-phosphatidyltransferase